jgi:hypothetical protein
MVLCADTLNDSRRNKMALFEKDMLKTVETPQPTPEPVMKPSCIVFNIYCGCGCEPKKKE